MNKFLFGFSVAVFIAGFVLLILKTYVGELDWITLVVAFGGMITACLTIWTSRMLKKTKG